MSGMHPQFMLSKRFPVHAAIELLDLPALASLFTPVSDARFHFSRKLTNNEVSVLHQACCNRTVPLQAWIDIVTVCLNLGAPVDDVDCIGQTPLFYAVTHCQANQIVPLLLKAGADVNVQRGTDMWSSLHLAAMMGKEKVVTILLESGADPDLIDCEGKTPAQVAKKYKMLKLAKSIETAPRLNVKKKLVKEIKSISQKTVQLNVQKNNLNTNIKSNDDVVMETMSEEVQWALEMKRELEEKEIKLQENKRFKEDTKEDTPKIKVEENKVLKPKKMTPEDRFRELKDKIERERKEKENPQVSQAQQLENIAEVMERKRQRRVASRNKMTEKERKERDDAAVRQAIYEDIIWALELKKNIAEEAGLMEEAEMYATKIQEEQEKKDGTWEKRKLQEERERLEKIEQEQLAIERKKQKIIEEELEEKLRKEIEEKLRVKQIKLEEESKKRKEKEAFNRLPDWKKQKILRQRKNEEDKLNNDKIDTMINDIISVTENLLSEEVISNILFEAINEDFTLRAVDQAIHLIAEEIILESTNVVIKITQEEDLLREKERHLEEAVEQALCFVEEEVIKEAISEAVKEKQEAVNKRKLQVMAEEESKQFKLKIEEQKAKEALQKQIDEDKIKEKQIQKEKLEKEKAKLKALQDDEKKKEIKCQAQEDARRKEEEKKKQEKEEEIQREEINRQIQETKKRAEEEREKLLKRVEDRTRKRKEEDRKRREEEEKNKKEEEEREQKRIDEQRREKLFENKIREEEEVIRRDENERKAREEEKSMKAVEKKKLEDEERKRKEEEVLNKNIEDLKKRREEEKRKELEELKRKEEKKRLRVEEERKQKEEQDRLRVEEDRKIRYLEEVQIREEQEIIRVEEENRKREEVEERKRKEIEDTIKIREEVIRTRKLEEVQKQEEMKLIILEEERKTRIVEEEQIKIENEILMSEKEERKRKEDEKSDVNKNETEKKKEQATSRIKREEQERYFHEEEDKSGEGYDTFKSEDKIFNNKHKNVQKVKIKDTEKETYENGIEYTTKADIENKYMDSENKLKNKFIDYEQEKTEIKDVNQDKRPQHMNQKTTEEIKKVKDQNNIETTNTEFEVDKYLRTEESASENNDNIFNKDNNFDSEPCKNNGVPKSNAVNNLNRSHETEFTETKEKEVKKIEAINNKDFDIKINNYENAHNTSECFPDDTHKLEEVIRLVEAKIVAAKKKKEEENNHKFEVFYHKQSGEFEKREYNDNEDTLQQAAVISRNDINSISDYSSNFPASSTVTKDETHCEKTVIQTTKSQLLENNEVQKPHRDNLGSFNKDSFEDGCNNSFDAIDNVTSIEAELSTIQLEESLKPKECKIWNETFKNIDQLSNIDCCSKISEGADENKMSNNCLESVDKEGTSEGKHEVLNQNTEPSQHEFNTTIKSAGNKEFETISEESINGCEIKRKQLELEKQERMAKEKKQLEDLINMVEMKIEEEKKKRNSHIEKE